MNTVIDLSLSRPTFHDLESLLEDICDTLVCTMQKQWQVYISVTTITILTIMVTDTIKSFIVLSILHPINVFKLPAGGLWNKDIYYFHFTNGEIEAQWPYEICPAFHDWEVVESVSRPRKSGSWVKVLDLNSEAHHLYKIQGKVSPTSTAWCIPGQFTNTIRPHVNVLVLWWQAEHSNFLFQLCLWLSFWF